jgi:hypothetical protein
MRCYGYSMKQAMCTVAVLVLSLAACGKSEWQDLTVRDAGFSVLMRGEPFYTKREIEVPAGRIVAHLYVSDRPDSVVAIGYTDYPIALVLGAPPEKLFAGVRDTWLNRLHGTLTRSDRPLKIDDKHPGIEFSADGQIENTEAFVRARLYLVDQRLYQVVILGKTAAVPSRVVNRYLDSFKLIEKQEVKAIQVQPPTPR